MCLISVVFLECAAVSKNNLHMIKELQQEISAAVIIIVMKPQLQLCGISSVGCRWSWVAMVNILKMVLCDCQSP
jgi:hypothetical protein